MKKLLFTIAACALMLETSAQNDYHMLFFNSPNRQMVIPLKDVEQITYDIQQEGEIVNVKAKDGYDYSFPVYQGESGVSLEDWFITEYSGIWSMCAVSKGFIDNIGYLERYNYYDDHSAVIGWEGIWGVTSNTTYALCIGTEQNPTMEDNDVIEPVKHWGSSYAILLGSLKGYEDANLKPNDTISMTRYPIQAGQTYHYRIVTRLPYMQGGEEKILNMYSRDYDFRIPLLMAQSGLAPYYSTDVVCPDNAAWTAFLDSHFENQQILSQEALFALWTEWVSANNDLANVTQTVEFDDGTLQLTNSMPEEFYQWLIRHEVVIPMEEWAVLEVHNGTYVKTVTGIDPQWNVPNNSYMCFITSGASLNPSVSFYVSEAIPGVEYELQVTLAPETEIEQNEENASEFLPTKFRIRGGTYYDEQYSSNVFDNQNYIAPATEVYQTTIKGFKDLNVVTLQTSVLSRERQMYSKTLRIADIRLKPEVAE